MEVEAVVGRAIRCRMFRVAAAAVSILPATASYTDGRVRMLKEPEPATAMEMEMEIVDREGAAVPGAMDSEA